MTNRWDAAQVLAMAPDAAAAAAGRSLATPARWTGPGATAGTVWGLCAGSGKNPYQVVVDVAGPACKCTCPSRKFPCKHVLALMLLWAAGTVPDQDAVPGFASAWLATRRAAAEHREVNGDRARTPDPVAARRRAQRRAALVSSGLEELDRWLRDQVRAGLAGAERAGYGPFDAIAARMVDAQAPAVAGALRRLPALATSGEGWPGRLLAAYARLRLLAQAHGRLAGLPEPLAATTRAHIGYPVSQQEVLAGEPVTDRWSVIGLRDSTEDRLISRRVWLRGERTGRAALILTFSPAGRGLGSDLIPGTSIEADLHYYPGTCPLRAVVGRRHGEPGTLGALHPMGLAEGLAAFAAALAADPWLLSWPVVLGPVTPVPVGTGWALSDASGQALPIAAGGCDCWRLLAVSGGHPVTVLCEWDGAAATPVSAVPSEPGLPPALVEL